MNAAFDLVVLDLDGTLVNLAVDWAAACRALLAVAQAEGLGSGETRVLPLLQAARACGRPSVAAAMEQVLNQAELQAIGRSPVNVDLLAWLEHLSPSTPVAVLSLNGRCAIEAALASLGLLDRVSAWVSRGEVERFKPDPEGLRKLIDQFGVEPARVLFIGDRPTDLECAQRAGARGLAVTEIGVRWELRSAEAECGQGR